MKRIIFMLAFTFFVFSSQMIVHANNQAPITVFIDGKKQTYDQPPVLLNGRTMVPMRGIFEALGTQVYYNASTKTIYADNYGMQIKMPLGNKTVNVNGKLITLDVEPRILNNRTLVPLRFVSESLGADVDWNSANKTIQIKTYSNNPVELNKALVAGNFPLMEKWVKGGTDPNSALNTALETGNVEGLRNLFKLGADSLEIDPLYPYLKDPRYREVILPYALGERLEEYGPKRKQFTTYQDTYYAGVPESTILKTEAFQLAALTQMNIQNLSTVVFTFPKKVQGFNLYRMMDEKHKGVGIAMPTGYVFQDPRETNWEFRSNNEQELMAYFTLYLNGKTAFGVRKAKRNTEPLYVQSVREKNAYQIEMVLSGKATAETVLNKDHYMIMNQQGEELRIKDITYEKAQYDEVATFTLEQPLIGENKLYFYVNGLEDSNQNKFNSYQTFFYVNDTKRPEFAPSIQVPAKSFEVTDGHITSMTLRFTEPLRNINVRIDGKVYEYQIDGASSEVKIDNLWLESNPDNSFYLECWDGAGNRSSIVTPFVDK
ncbi:copper amine oxidase N-terminal domain-containing protein [Cytobacillus depressus]|uniref:copper amine oxidase N-terminal domain-containing protein n=1 Tax=Cytobacillus depressus TaxID=1602942 RepID=UPI001478E437|nr:copper amine oxidase N-terminal domain-containing protein [Cytobacillus depressus]